MNQVLPLLLSQIFAQELLIQASFSNPHIVQKVTKIGIRPVRIKEKLAYQLSEKEREKVLHRNVGPEECKNLILEDLVYVYRQGILHTKEADIHLLTNRKGITTILNKPPTKQSADLSHNRTKNYLLEEGVAVPYLIALGVMNSQGKILPEKRDKFRQINRFLEMVSDTLAVFPEGSNLSVIDFCCGKAYLTFSLFYFLEARGFKVQMVGLDTKEEVIALCQNLAQSLNATNLTFTKGDIASYTSSQNVDIAVALHACDIATDLALDKAVRCKAKVILAAPCCQKELKKQIDSEPLEAILQHGILQERVAAIATDAARADLLEMQGYKTQVVEFIESEHTAKNLLIRAIFGNSKDSQGKAKLRYESLKKSLSVEPALERLFTI